MQVKKSEYRQRIYQNADGSIQIVFGNEPVLDPSMKLWADHDIVDIVQVSDHVEPAS